MKPRYLNIVALSLLLAQAFVPVAALAQGKTCTCQGRLTSSTNGASAANGETIVAPNVCGTIPFDQISAVAEKQYAGDGLAVVSTSEGARLSCAFQRLNARVTAEGLWLVSTVGGAKGQPFRVIARAVGRGGAEALALTGKVAVAGSVAQFIRPGLTEEYSVSVDGLRQDYLIEQRPRGTGPVLLELEVNGAKAEPLGDGARLVLAVGGRKLVYSRLKAVDALGKPVRARMEVVSAGRLAVVLEDTAAEYPVRIDPTFSDANWISLGGIRNNGGVGTVWAAVVDGIGNLYIGGIFTQAGNTIATNIAKWDGHSWSPLGLGVNKSVDALAVSGTNLYAGGDFTNASGLSVNYIAKWNGNSWSALGAGTDHPVFALAVAGNTLYAGGRFWIAGGLVVNSIAQWNGTSWSALGSGMNQNVYALAVSGTTLYAGGLFTTAGGVSANYIAQWNGSSWSPLGSGMGGGAFPLVQALAVSGTGLYAGGQFTNAGGVMANSIAQWDGSSWSALGSGISGAGDGFGPIVQALAVSGTILYAGGDFNFAGGMPADYIAQWNGSSWSALGSGLDNQVYALALSGTNLYVGGNFTTAGTNASAGAAEAIFPKAPATVILSNLVQPYDGTAKTVTTTTIPPGLTVSVTYNGSANAPTNVGSYTVIGTINDPSYQGSVTNMLRIVLQLAAPAWDGNGHFQFSFNTASGVNYTIQISTDLKNWISALTYRGSGGPLTIIDPNASSSSWCFYRLMIGP